MRSILFTIFLMSGTWSCSPTYQACKDKFGYDTLVVFKDTTFIIYDTVRINGDTLGDEISLSDLLGGYEKETHRQITRIIYKDGKIKYVNICKDSIIYRTHKIYYSYKDKTVNYFKKILEIKWWWWLILIAMIVSVGYFIQSFKK
jgi:hypothetical protein